MTAAPTLPVSVPVATVAEGPLGKGGRWNWYQEPGGTEHQPMTNLLKHLDTDTYNLDQWRARQVLVGAARREDIIIGARAIGLPGPDGFTKEQKSTLNRLARDAQNAAEVSNGATLGTAMHTATERIDRGEPLSAISFPEPYASSLRAYAQLVQLNGWECVEIERTVRVDELGVAGTFDRAYRIPGLGVVIGDVKTEENPLLNLLNITAQLAGYSRGTAMWSRAAQAWVPMPEGLRTDVAVLVHVRDGAAVPYVIDLSRGWTAAQRAAAQRDDVRAAKTKLGEQGAWAQSLDVRRPETLPAAALVERRAVNDPQVQAHARSVLGLDEPPRTELGTPAAPGAAWSTAVELAKLIKTADSRDQLSAAYEYAQRCGIEWTGLVAELGAARLRIVECVQRALHRPSSTEQPDGVGLCACGWTTGDRP